MVECKIFSECKIFLGVKYFRESKIFSSVWLYYENCSIKCFHVFGYIMEMLFSYYLLTFSQLPNKFYNRKFQYINLKKQKSKQHHSVKLREGGRESDQKWRERERSVMGNDNRATRSVMGNDGADEIGFGWIGLRW